LSNIERVQQIFRLTGNEKVEKIGFVK